MIDLFSTTATKEKLHPKYETIKNHLFLTGEHDVLKDWIDGFEDRDNKIVYEFQTTFHSSFWEFYLFAVFKEAGFEIDFTKNRPDFIINKPQKFYVEAVVANIKKDGSQEEQRTLRDIISMIEPAHMQQNFNENLTESIVRYSNAILSKSEKYTGYSKKGKYHKGYSEDDDYDTTAPYLIALSGYEQINYGNNFYYAIFALLYGLYYDNLNDKYTKKENIIKPNSTSEIPIGLFLNEKMEHISAIIFSSTVTLGKLTSLSISQNKSNLNLNTVLCMRHDTEPPHFKPQIVSSSNPEFLSDGLFIFHNPFAKNPMDKNLFKDTNIININFNIETGMKTFEGNNLPIVSRLNLFAGEQFFKNSIYQIIENFNPDLVFIFAEALEIVELVNDKKSFEVLFNELDDNIEFTIEFTSEKFQEYKVKEKERFLITFSLEKNIEIKSVEQFKIYQKMSKLRCLSFEEGTIIDIKNLTKHSSQ